MTTINERFSIIVERWFNGNDLRFAKSMGKFSSSFSKIIHGTVNPRAATLQRVCTVVPELNPTWLLTGEGQIMRSPNPLAGNERAAYEDIIKAKTEELQSKTELVTLLKQQVQDLREFNKILRDNIETKNTERNTP